MIEDLLNRTRHVVSGVQSVDAGRKACGALAAFAGEHLTGDLLDKALDLIRDSIISSPPGAAARVLDHCRGRLADFDRSWSGEGVGMKCPLCGADAYAGATTVECPTAGCANGPPGSRAETTEEKLRRLGWCEHQWPAAQALDAGEAFWVWPTGMAHAGIPGHLAFYQDGELRFVPAADVSKTPGPGLVSVPHD